jgi:hypothetical protein
MKGYGRNGSDYEKTTPGDTETIKRIKEMADTRDAMKGTSLLLGNRRMRRDKKDGRTMER